MIILIGYFLGSIPTAYIAGHILKGVDIRQVGDENMGAANVYRQLNKDSIDKTALGRLGLLVEKRLP